MSDRIPFFYCHGTSYLFRMFGVPLDIDISIPLTSESDRLWYEVAGLRGETYGWDGFPANDPFPDLLDTNLFAKKRIWYPASFFAIGASIDFGRDAVLAEINALPAGTPFALGGYSQGAAVMVKVWGALSSARRADMLGAVTFGNPMRAVNHRGPIGGTWSGQMGVAGSTTGGGGSFPTSGPFGLMPSPPPNWVDFAAPDDVFTSVGLSNPFTAGWRTLIDTVLDQSLSEVTSTLLGVIGGLFMPGAGLDDAFNFFFLSPEANAPIYVVDGANNFVRYDGAGHVTYPFLPPPAANGVIPTTSIVSGGQTYLKPVGDTCYQLAARWLESLAGQWTTTPIVVPETLPASSAWATTLTITDQQASLAAWSPSF